MKHSNNINPYTEAWCVTNRLGVPLKDDDSIHYSRRNRECSRCRGNETARKKRCEKIILPVLQKNVWRRSGKMPVLRRKPSLEIVMDWNDTRELRSLVFIPLTSLTSQPLSGLQPNQEIDWSRISNAKSLQSACPILKTYRLCLKKRPQFYRFWGTC